HAAVLCAPTRVMQMAMVAIRVVGPSAAGLLVASFGPNICYAVDFVSFLASAALIGTVPIILPPFAPRATAESANSKWHAILHDMGEGARFIVHHAAISFVVMAMGAGVFVMGCFGARLSVY